MAEPKRFLTFPLVADYGTGPRIEGSMLNWVFSTDFGAKPQVFSHFMVKHIVSGDPTMRRVAPPCPRRCRPATRTRSHARHLEKQRQGGKRHIARTDQDLPRPHPRTGCRTGPQGARGKDTGNRGQPSHHIGQRHHRNRGITSGGRNRLGHVAQHGHTTDFGPSLILRSEPPRPSGHGRVASCHQLCPNRNHQPSGIARRQNTSV